MYKYIFFIFQDQLEQKLYNQIWSNDHLPTTTTVLVVPLSHSVYNWKKPLNNDHLSKMATFWRVPNDRFLGQKWTFYLQIQDSRSHMTEHIYCE